MKHVRLDIERLAVDGIDRPLAYGDVLVVEQDGHDGLQWELVVMFLGKVAFDEWSGSLDVLTLEGRRLAGEAFLVRAREQMHVFRGTSQLDGLLVDELGA